ncbi:MAG: PAS domain-containing protein [Leptolyngbyaceae cyanobacterium bins.59]|nr:PAS domain-containing protein [Leptolyngbyaceae cyanobacterium bins.59]
MEFSSFNACADGCSLAFWLLLGSLWIVGAILLLVVIVLWRQFNPLLFNKLPQMVFKEEQAAATLRDREERLNLALGAAKMGVWEVDLITGEQLWSPQSQAIWGFAPGTFDGKLTSFLNRIHPDDRAIVQRANQSALEVGHYQQEYRIIWPDQSIHWLSNRAQVFYDATGKPIRMIGIDLDITDRKQAELGLQQSEEQYRKLAEDMPALICKFLPDSTLTYVNSAYGQYFGKHPDELLGQPFLNLLPTEAIQQTVQTHYMSLTPEAPSGILEHPITKPDGNEVWQRWINRAFFDDQGQIVEFQAIGFDITDRKRIETELRDQQARLNLALEAANMGIWEGDLVGTEILSPQAEALLGFAPGTFDGKRESFIQRVHPDDLALIRQSERTVMETGYLKNEFRVVWPDQSVHWIYSLGKLFHDGEGHPIRIGGVDMDITERKQAEQQLKNLVEATAATTGQNFFPALVSHIAQALNVGYALVTEEVDGSLQALAFWANGALQPTFSYHPAKTPCELALRNGRFYCECLVQQMFPEDGDLVQMQAESYLGIALWDTNGQAIGNLCILNQQRIPNPQQAETLLRVFAARATAELERERATRSLEQMNHTLETLVAQRTATIVKRTAQLEASNRELESFSYSVSHDLRAPLRHIHGFINALQQRLHNHSALNDPKVIHYLQVIENSSQKMALLIDGLLTLSRIGRQSMGEETVQLQHLVEEAIVLAQTQSSQAQSVEFVIHELPTVQGDATLLQQVMSNLIGNAVKFSRNQANPRVEIGTTPEGTFFVKDNGVGFQMEYADKLFGAFQRLHTQNEFEGTGIGLAIVQRIIHRHGGTIWAESQPNHGAIFYFMLGNSLENQESVAGMGSIPSLT